MQKVLRVLNGRRAGAVFVLSGRTVIGRAGHVDIQLVHETVSRQHAKLVVDEHGDVVLTDLSSDNGTFVNGESVSRRVLRPGDTICVADTRFVYEHVAAESGLRSSQVFSQRATSADSLRQTAPHRILLPADVDQAKEARAGQYLRQPDPGHRRRERVTPTGTVAPGGRTRSTPTGVRASAPGAAEPTAPQERGVPQQSVEPEASRAGRRLPFATGAPSGSEEPTHPIALTPPWAPAPEPMGVEPDAPLERSTAPTRPEPGARPVVGTGVRGRPTAEYAVGDTVAVPGAPVASRFDRNPARHAFRRRATAEYGASWSDDTETDPFDPEETYGAEALLDVLAYRHLRLRSLRGDPLDVRDRSKFATLERRLEHDPEPGEELALKRRFHRFACNLPLDIASDPDASTRCRAGRMLDLSAGGAQVRIDGAPVDAGDTVWLSILLPDLAEVAPHARDARRVILESRVIWRSPNGDRIGVIFAGEAAFKAS